eukprot:TRINITY_DN16559_c1_g1_i1.p1 TRINITY_DN16559_c1_g1~~TRINITY_DN16559_c1_g1_i1.p1  ORF type:complete len:73 (-),score=13.01 TRINITY_DN16559_c1_g1_i1:73-291(-)
MKQYVVEEKKQKKKAASSEQCCLIRAKCGKKRISTVIKSKDLIAFQLAYANIIKAEVDGLKKRKKRKKKVTN